MPYEDPSDRLTAASAAGIECSSTVSVYMLLTHVRTRLATVPPHMLHFSSAVDVSMDKIHGQTKARSQVPLTARVIACSYEE